MNPLDLINNFINKNNFESAKALNSYLQNHAFHQEHVLLLLNSYLIVLQASYGESLKDGLLSKFNENITRHIDQLSSEDLFRFMNIHFGSIFEKEKMFKNMLLRKDKTKEMEDYCIKEVIQKNKDFFTYNHDVMLKIEYLNPDNILYVLKNISVIGHDLNNTVIFMKELCLKSNASFEAKNYVLQKLQEHKKSLSVNNKKQVLIISKTQKTILKTLGNSPKEEILKLLY